MSRKVNKPHKMYFLIGVLFIMIPVTVFNFLPLIKFFKDSVFNFSSLLSADFYATPNNIVSLFIISLCLITVLSILLIYSHHKSKKILKGYKELIKRQHQELGLINNDLDSYKEELRVHNIAKEKLFSIVAKDLKKPLLALKSYAYTLKTKDGNFSPWELTTYATSLEKSLSHLISVLNNVSRWSMVQNPLPPSQLDNINVNKMISYTLHLMQSSANNKRIALLKNINCKVEIMGDAYMIEFILRNLVANAIKFSNNGSVVMVKLRSDEDYFSISVKDQGVGMTEEKIAQLFNIDEKANSHKNNDQAQSALGLVLCNEFLQKMGGTIDIQSKPNEGSLFTVSLPKNVYSTSRVNGEIN